MAVQPPSTPPPPSPEPQPRPHLAVGTVVADRYQILEVLGEGSMGTVYAVEHLLLKKKMAVKILHPELTAVKSLAIRFEREAMATAKLDHPNVAAAVDFGRLLDGTLYLALEFVEGCSLRDEISKGAFPLARALHVARQIASLLAAAQPLGIVHRDLKPENVMLIQRGEVTDFVKVLDFGIARMTGLAEGGSEPAQALTKVGAVFGTPEYMAPEQALGQRVDTRADLYSLGVMLFEMIAGVRPYVSSGGQPAILAQQITAPRPSFKDVAPSIAVPEAIERVVNRLLAKGVSDRYQRASDVVQILEHLASGDEAVGPGGSLVPAQAAPLPAFELQTRVPGLIDIDPKAAEPMGQPGSRATSPKVIGQRSLELVRAKLVSTGAYLGVIATALRDRLTQRLGPRVSGIPPLAVLTFCIGLGIGLVVAVAIWLVAAMRHSSALDAARLTAASAAANASASASAAVPPAIPSGVTSFAPATIDNSKDPDVLLDSMQAKLQQGRDSEAIGLVVRVLAKHPDRRSDGRIAEALFRMANSNAKDVTDTAFSLLEGTMATKGADILYQLWLDKAVREATRRRAEKWLRGEQFTRTASNATVMATRLRMVESCEKKHDLLSPAAKAGTQFVLAYLRELDIDQGCGMDGKADCYPCLRKDSRLKESIAQIEARISK